ncbi:hypothetical protein BpHYR1_054680 [Brachionus plicatilis]|uniref:Uncharacterized protein n=1 Tax=Brachionus plicatilis TaxID=10195 RepID=A0A3M7SJ92_BRAPC|nr:hypothetical protein BpHYR1_054680 [Brachionus plicatilis]
MVFKLNKSILLTTKKESSAFGCDRLDSVDAPYHGRICARCCDAQRCKEADLVMDKITFGNDVGPSTGESETGGAEGSKVHRVVVEFSPWKSSEVLAQ